MKHLLNNDTVAAAFATCPQLSLRPHGLGDIAAQIVGRRGVVVFDMREVFREVPQGKLRDILNDLTAAGNLVKKKGTQWHADGHTWPGQLPTQDYWARAEDVIGWAAVRQARTSARDARFNRQQALEELALRHPDEFSTILDEVTRK